MKKLYEFYIVLIMLIRHFDFYIKQYQRSCYLVLTIVQTMIDINFTCIFPISYNQHLLFIINKKNKYFNYTYRFNVHIEMSFISMKDFFESIKCCMWKEISILYIG